MWSEDKGKDFRLEYKEDFRLEDKDKGLWSEDRDKDKI